MGTAEEANDKQNYSKNFINFPDGAGFSLGARLTPASSLPRALDYKSRLAFGKNRFKENYTSNFFATSTYRD